MSNSSRSVNSMAEAILQEIGGKENIISLSYCMTRLRVLLKDAELADFKAIKETEGVMGIVCETNELQIILGPGKVTKIVQEIGHITGIEIGSVDEAELRRQELKAKNSTPFKLFLRKLANIFIPLIPALIGCGLIMGINNIMNKFVEGFAGGTVSGILGILGSAVFFGLNIMVGVNAAKEFGGSPMLGGTMAGVLTAPALANIQISDKALVPGRGGIIAVLLVVAFSCWIEKRIRKIVPDILDTLVTPLITVLIGGLIAIFTLQPIGGFISDAIGRGVAGIIETGGIATGFILAGAFLPLVMTGLHHGLIPIHAHLIESTGVTLLLPILAMAGAGQVGASLAVYRKTKNARLRKTILSGLPVGIMGIGEPLIYGVTLPLGKPFIGACIGGAFGGAFIALVEVGAFSLGVSGVPLALIVNKPLMYLIAVMISYVVGYIATSFLGFEDLAE